MQLAADRPRQLDEPALHVHVDVLELPPEREACRPRARARTASRPCERWLSSSRLGDQPGPRERARPRRAARRGRSGQSRRSKASEAVKASAAGSAPSAKRPDQALPGGVPAAVTRRPRGRRPRRGRASRAGARRSRHDPRVTSSRSVARDGPAARPAEMDRRSEPHGERPAPRQVEAPPAERLVGALGSRRGPPARRRGARAAPTPGRPPHEPALTAERALREDADHAARLEHAAARA